MRLFIIFAAMLAHSFSYRGHGSVKWVWSSVTRSFWDIWYIGSYTSSGVHYHVYKCRRSGLPWGATHIDEVRA